MGVPYNLFYRLGFTPWEDAEDIPEFVEELSALRRAAAAPTDRRSTSAAAAGSGAF